ncbi:hypothetical protein CAPTEDRAFT_1709 [Capitella teleta]|uniref:SOCS box domain-containing protein n=1 Tax=Capitella teleta TaxID=283909 RepID=R7UIA1_CAPTE|nr:hypothetical protein CAPTEDRAFT_1709 [Capitella teleta]|eukprot:ELU05935.1 hypothetical protein CAPTEDRAFT_1709 [Capitella teleta]
MELLIEYGADVNKRSGRGSTCLHCVIQEDWIDAVELLLKHGADVNIKNNAGYDAFHTAIFRGCPEVLAVLTKHSQPSIQRQIEYQELMGTTFASEMDDTAKALQHWRTAMLMRQQHGRMLSPNDTKPPLPVYLHNVEAITPEHLAALAASSDRVVIQSLIVTERLLGPDHERTVSRLMHMGLVCVQSLDYQRGVDVWKYAFHVAQGNLRLHVLQELVLLFLHMDKAHSVHGTSRETVSHEDVSSIFSTICDEVEAASITRTTSKENVRTMVLLLLHVLRLLSRIATEPADVLALRCRVHNLNKIRLVKGRTLLHLALDFQSSSIGDIFYYKFPNLQVVKLLLSCGANVNAVDIGGKNTPLHLCSKLTHLAEKYKVAEVAEVLVAHGAHVDACNELGQLASACFSRLPMKLSVPPANRVSLKCLAARAVKRNRIPYEREVPATLNSFIELH